MQKNKIEFFISILCLTLAIATIAVGTVGCVCYDLGNEIPSNNLTNAQRAIKCYTDLLAKLLFIFMIFAGLFISFLSINRIATIGLSLKERKKADKIQAQQDEIEIQVKQIEKLHLLVEKGILSEEEFTAKKNQILSIDD